jgi:hypothetical protein
MATSLHSRRAISTSMRWEKVLFSCDLVLSGFLYQMMIIPRLGERLGCMIYRRRLEMDMEELKPELSILRCAADELKSSVKLKRLLAVSVLISSTPTELIFRSSAHYRRFSSLGTR